MDLHTFLINLPKEEREPFASGCGSTFDRLMQIAYGNEPARAELCTAIDWESGSTHLPAHLRAHLRDHADARETKAGTA